MKRKEGGFTIVEVVIAVTVIGVLLIIAMTTLNGLTAKGRDATRRARAEAMALDLERYYKYNNILVTLQLCKIPLVLAIG